MDEREWRDVKKNTNKKVERSDALGVPVRALRGQERFGKSNNGQEERAEADRGKDLSALVLFMAPGYLKKSAGGGADGDVK